MTFTRLAFAASLAATAIAAPAPARAADDCVKDSITFCREEFSGKDYYSVAMRGWCYMISIAICKALT